MQPERINPMTTGGKYDQKSDVWSYGITMVSLYHLASVAGPALGSGEAQLGSGEAHTWGVGEGGLYLCCSVHNCIPVREVFIRLAYWICPLYSGDSLLFCIMFVCILYMDLVQCSVLFTSDLIKALLTVLYCTIIILQQNIVLILYDFCSMNWQWGSFPIHPGQVSSTN